MFLPKNIARVDLDELTPPQKALVRLVQFLIGLGDQINRDKVIIRSSGLAYSSLLAAVPLIAVVFSLLSAFGALDELKVRVQEFLISNLLPTRQYEIVTKLDQFTSNAAKVGFLGFALFALAAILLLDNVENNFNDIFHVTSRRRVMNKVTAYTSVLVLGTLFIGTSLSLSTRFNAWLDVGVPLDLSFSVVSSAGCFPWFWHFLPFSSHLPWCPSPGCDSRVPSSGRQPRRCCSRSPKGSSPTWWVNRCATRRSTGRWR